MIIDTTFDFRTDTQAEIRTLTARPCADTTSCCGASRCQVGESMFLAVRVARLPLRTLRRRASGNAEERQQLRLEL